MTVELAERINALDGWRTISIGLVIFSHIFLYSNGRFGSNGELARLFYNPVLDELGFLGVKIFFVISGFVICRGLVQERAKRGRISLLGFYIRRFLRIIPPLFLYVASIYCLAHFGLVERQATAVTRALTFTCNFPNVDCGGYLGAHTWSLSVEEQFYLVIPILLSLITLPSRLFVLLLIVVMPLTVISLSILNHSAAAQFVSQFLPISIGVACALHEDWVKRYVSRLTSAHLYGAVIVLLLVLRLTDTRIWQIATTI